MTCAKFFRFSAASSAISGLCPSLSCGKFTEHVLSAGKPHHVDAAHSLIDVALNAAELHSVL